MTAFTASVEEFKRIKTRGVYQLVLEVDESLADQALNVIGGLPKSGSNVHVAVARLNPDYVENKSLPPTTSPQPAKTPGERAVIRAALLCQDRGFQAWWGEKDADECANKLRAELGIKSRSEIAINKQAFNRFIEIETEFNQATGRIAEIRG